MVAVLGFSKEDIKKAVTDMYTVVAEAPSTPMHFPIGREACLLAGYSEQQISGLPQETLVSFAGVGCPFSADVIRPGHTVLDIGSGSGTDVLISSRLVGDSGRVIALDLTPAMRNKLQETLEKNGIRNAEILQGDAEQIPLPDESVDVVTSNGVLNLVADKRRAIAEIFRVLKPGGAVQIADIVIANPVTPDCEDDPKLWAECVVGATVDETYLEMFTDAGFHDLEIMRDYDYFSNSPSQETQQVARQFGAHGIELRMRRGAAAPVKILQFGKRLSPARVIRNVQKRGLWGVAALGMSLVACYGTIAILGLLSALGLSAVLNNGIWAGAIVAFAAAATMVVGLGARKHKSMVPFALSLAGTAVLGYTMFVNYSIAIEIAGFVLLGWATYLDYDLRRWVKVPGGKDVLNTRQE